MTATIITVIVACIGSSGLWAAVQAGITARQKKQDGQSAEVKLMLGLGYAKIMDLCDRYIEQGYITKDQYEDLNKYLYEPYAALGGDGTAEKLMQEVKKLPIRSHE